jgi:hypothetical protein
MGDALGREPVAQVRRSAGTGDASGQEPVALTRGNAVAGDAWGRIVAVLGSTSVATRIPALLWVPVVMETSCARTDSAFILNLAASMNRGVSLMTHVHLTGETVRALMAVRDQQWAAATRRRNVLMESVLV